MENTDHPINKKIIGHLLFILSSYIFLSIWLVDLEIPAQRSLVFYIFFVVCIAYTIASNAISSSLIPQTNYELPFSLSGMIFGIWLAIVDLNYSSVPSCYTAIFLLFSTLGAFLCGSYWANHRRESRENNELLLIDLVPAVIIMISIFLIALYILVVGSWVWPVMDLFEALEELTAESSRNVKPLFMYS